jgi:ketosteroid isomerase-like protein
MRNLCIALAFALCLPIAVFAQEWSLAQKEVWKVEETIIAAFQKGDLETAMSFVHPDYRGLHHGSPVPIDKAIARQQFADMTKNYHTRTACIQPLAIQIFGNTAIVHYVATVTLASYDERPVTIQAAWTDVFIKQGEKWLVVADNGTDLKQ